MGLGRWPFLQQPLPKAYAKAWGQSPARPLPSDFGIGIGWWAAAWGSGLTWFPGGLPTRAPEAPLSVSLPPTLLSVSEDGSQFSGSP